MTLFNIALAYSNRSSLTGRALKLALRARGHRAFRPVDTTITRAPVAIFFGTTEAIRTPNATTLINSAETCRRASDKLTMLQTLLTANIPIPTFTSNLTATTTDLDAYRNRDGYFYVRDRRGVTRFDNTIDSARDSYVSKPVVYKRREYRVHVFNGEIFAAYDKVPHDDETRPPLFKVDNCKFSKIDLSRSRLDSEGQRIAIDAVNALGLTYGAVDVIRDKRGGFTVCEVNSSAGLNSVNIERLCDLIIAKAENDRRRSI